MPIVTGLGIARNVLVVKNGEAVIAVAGGAGTLSEIGVALKLGRPVVAIGRYACLDGITPATTPETRCRVFSCSGAPKRKAFMAATGRAPMVNTSRRMPPTPVAAPW